MGHRTGASCTEAGGTPRRMLIMLPVVSSRPQIRSNRSRCTRLCPISIKPGKKLENVQQLLLIPWAGSMHADDCVLGTTPPNRTTHAMWRCLGYSCVYAASCVQECVQSIDHPDPPSRHLHEQGAARNNVTRTANSNTSHLPASAVLPQHPSCQSLQVFNITGNAYEPAASSNLGLCLQDAWLFAWPSAQQHTSKWWSRTTHIFLIDGSKSPAFVLLRQGKQALCSSLHGALQLVAGSGSVGSISSQSM